MTGLFGLSACAPMVQGAAVPPAGFAGPRLETGAFVTGDGTVLPMEVWAAQGEPSTVLVALHGMNDYARAFAYGSAAWWASQGITTYAYDQRGFGRAPHRGVWAGTELMVEDLRTFTALLRARHPGAVVGVLGHSMGGAVAIAAFASDRPPVADRLIVAAPAVWGWREQPLANRAALWVSAHIAPSWKLSAPRWLVERVRASDNLEVLLAMGRDPNMIFDTRIDAIYGLVQLMQQADNELGRVRTPLLYLYGAHDQIIPRPATLHAARGLKAVDRSAYYPNGWHLLTRDLQGPAVWADVAAYLRDSSMPLPSGVGPLPKG
ncbi:MAG TPA: lysophospholipase [Caulobacteraceae bacterium]|jgi:alpha-beta hydrolase superfamily lysophospholipase|nr:lysophospholipase [Caulobacteraceae bacterium]